MVSSDKTAGDQIPPKLRRKLAQLYQQMEADEEAGGVQPPPVVNRRTGEVHEFGPRRAFDGPWLLELLRASGCTKEEVDAAIFVLEPLIEYKFKINAHLLSVMSDFYDRPTEAQRREKFAKLKRSRFHVVRPSGKPSDANK